MKQNKIPLIFGEVLFDCFPDGRETLGGAPFNVAWNLQAFGMLPIIVSRIGSDTHGQRIIEKMKSWAMVTDFLQIDQSHPTGQVMIQLKDGEPKFTILPEQAYDYISPPVTELPRPPAFLYHGSLALRNETNRKTLARLKKDNQCPVFVDVNLRSPWWNTDNIYQNIEDATWLKLNENELDILFPSQDNLEQRCTSLRRRFGLEAIFVTRGSKGAVAKTGDTSYVSVKPRYNIDIADTVGAGDAFSSILLVGLTKKWSLEIILKRAQEFASAVVGLRGAISEERNFYQNFITQWEM